VRYIKKNANVFVAFSPMDVVKFLRIIKRLLFRLMNVLLIENILDSQRELWFSVALAVVRET
jgi:hypothetical protein